MQQHVILIAIGSSGDVHPLVGLGLAMQQRGHRVTVATNDYFAPLIERVGLGFASLGTVGEFDSALNDPNVWHPARGLKALVTHGLGVLVARVYDLLAELHVPGQTVAAGTLLAVGARIAQDKLGLPYASVAFAPVAVRSVVAMPRMPVWPLPPGAPQWLKAAMYGLADAMVMDPLLAPPINAVRAQVGLSPVRHIVSRWWYSPQLNLCMWPPLFAPVQTDWPVHSVLTGFPLYDESSTAPLPPAVAAFLNQPAGPPIVFTPGTAMRFGGDFFQAAVAACQRLQRRGLLLTRYPEQLPAVLPPSVMHAAYVPFSQLLQHAAALVHHGGIGTTSQALSAGVPQLIMPMAHDQFDNADRVQRLGVGRWLPRRQFTADRVAAELQDVMTDPQLAAAVQRSAKALAPHTTDWTSGCDAAADQLEALMRANSGDGHANIAL